jgi:protoheme ferro-lyase
MKLTKSIYKAFIVTTFLVFNLISAVAVSADLTFNDIKIPSDYPHGGKTLTLSGATYRKVGFLRVKVWLSALYVEKKIEQALPLINSDQTKVITLFPLYDVSASDSVKGWKLSLDENCDANCKKLAPEVKKFLDSVPEFKKKDRYVYIFTKDGMSYSVNDKELFKSNQPELGKVILSTWLGPRQADKDIEKSLLGTK